MSRIMVVDDDRMMVNLLQTLLEIDGFEVEVVTQGIEVIPAAETTPPDLILMDYNLADINGLEVLKAIRQHPTLSKLPVIMASGMAVADEALAAGASHFLIKPYEPEELPDLINRWITS